MEAASRLAGGAGAVLGWSPDAFWQATPTELGAVIGAIVGQTVVPPDGATLARLKEAFPDDGGVPDG